MNDLLADKPMHSRQVLAVVVCVLLTALDGFDVLAISFAAPGIAAEWSIAQSTLGWVMTMELIGMGVGSIFLGQAGDKFGRRPIILLSLAVMTIGMFVSALAPNVIVLSIARIATGVGIGAVLACANAATAELSNSKNRSLAVTFMAAGYAIGGVIGGIIASKLLEVYDWRSVFFLGAFLTALAIPIVLALLPESVVYLATKRPANALQKINKILTRFGHDAILALPDLSDVAVPKGGIQQLLGIKLIKVTLLLSLALLAHISTFYFVLKWIPSLVSDMGFDAASAGRILVWVNLGALGGAFVFGVLTKVVDLRYLSIAMLIGAAVMVCIFGQVGTNLSALAMVSVVCGFFNNAAAISLYPLMARYFPPEVRAGGTGLVLGIGRGGAIAGPVIAGYLFAAGIPLSQVAIIISIGSLTAAIAIFFLGPNRASE